MGEVETSCCRDLKLGGDSSCVSPVALEGDGGGDRGILLSYNHDVSGRCMCSGCEDCGVFEPLQASEEASLAIEKSAAPVGAALEVFQHNVCCENPCNNNGVHVDIENDSEALVVENEEKGECPVLALGALVKAPKVGTEEENYDFSGLSPLREEGVAVSSGIDIVGLFDEGRDCNGCGDAILVPSGQAEDCSLIDVSNEVAKEADGYCCMSASNNCEVTWTNGRCENSNSGEDNQLPNLESAEGFLSPERVSGISHCDGVEEKRCQTSHEREACGSVQGSASQSAPCSELEKLASPSGHVPDGVVHCPAEQLVESAVQRTDSDVVTRTPACCGNVVDPCQQADNRGRDTEKSSSIIVFRRTNPKRAASLKISQTNERFNQLTRKKSNSRKSKEPVGTSTSLSSSIMNILSSKVRRKRSCFLKTARISVWGAIENIVDIFKQNEAVARKDFDPIQTKNKRSGKGRSAVHMRKQQTGQKPGSLRASKCKSAASSGSMRVKYPRYLKPIFPDVNDCLVNANFQIDSSISEMDGEDEHKLAEYRCGMQVNSFQRDGQHCEKDLESSVTQETSVENTPSDCPGISSQVGHGASLEAVDRHSLDPGTSPDSDVFHPAIDAAVIVSEGATSIEQGAEMGQNRENPELGAHDGVHAADWTSSEALLTYLSIPKKGKKGTKNVESNRSICPPRDHPYIEEKFHSVDKQNTAIKASTNSMLGQNTGNGSSRSHSRARSAWKTSRKGSKNRGSPMESNTMGVAELDCCQERIEVEAGPENWQVPGKDTGNTLVEACLLEGSLAASKSKGRKLRKKAGGSKRRSSHHDSAGCRRPGASGAKKGNLRKSDCKVKSDRDNQALDTYLEGSGSLCFPPVAVSKSALTGSTESKLNTGSKVPSEDLLCSVTVPLGAELAQKESFKDVEGKYTPPRAAWVLCDDCQKWRCISAELADVIDETNSRWTCKDNKDKAFADCSIPQEKTNAEINAELEISDEEDAFTAKASSKEFELSNSAGSQSGSWKLIKSNLFLRRNRKTQNIDEVMVCQCKPPLDGSLGCGEECLNRMINIECVRGTCPCGDLCSNQQFQKRKYVKFKWIHCGKKGYGLQLQEAVAKGQFLIEYVGEVLDLASYEARQRYYASRGQKHFYFMTLSGGEVIDACAKGNLGRFINHSCEPNCETQKWIVNGELCIGLFALRDVKKGEEVTFDYNYERVFGAAAKKCVCGSSQCRGYIGGDPLNTEVIVQGDSDEEYPEPVMVNEVSEEDRDVADAMFDMDVKVAKNEEVYMQVKVDEGISLQTTDIVSRDSPAIPESEVPLENEDTLRIPLSDSNPLDITLQITDLLQSEDTLCRSLPEIQFSENSVHGFNTSQTEETDCKPSSDIPVEISSQPLTTTHVFKSESASDNKELVVSPAEDKPITSKSRSSGTIKRGKTVTKASVPHKIKKMLTGASGGHFEGVEDKLNRLLDAEGGISKRKDATRGYLRLLYVTAAEGNNVGGASQSVRDLSLILDALLKTKSRTVLVDIINKNGLQMLHNIMKQNRENFNRTPIIRKLFKVLDFLAQKGILTSEHMNKGPPCSGMESFKESVMRLTKHSDMKVHRIARNFRDKWIPRTFRRVELSDRDDGMSQSQGGRLNWFQPSLYKHHRDHGARDCDAIICVSEAHVQTSSYEVEISRGICPPHFRSVSTPAPQSGEICPPHFQHVSSFAPLSTDSNPTSGTRTRKRKSRWDQPSDVTSPDLQSSQSVSDQSLETRSKFMKPSSKIDHSVQFDVPQQYPETPREENRCDDSVVSGDPTQLLVDDEAPPGFKAPPGFESPCMDYHPQIALKSSVASDEAVMGHLQERYLPHLAVSYGIPVALMQQLGTTEDGGSQSEAHWAVAPGMPFHPFPPLPPYPRRSSGVAAGDHTYASDKSIHQGVKGEAQLSNTCGRSGSGERTGGFIATGARRMYSAGRVRWASGGSGRRFFRPYWRNNRKFQGHWHPWPRERNDRGYRDSSRDGVLSLDVGCGRRDGGEGFCSSEDMNNENVSSNFHQQSQHD